MNLTKRGDDVADFKRRRQDFQSDGVMDLTMASGRRRLKVALEDSTWQRCHVGNPCVPKSNPTVEKTPPMIRRLSGQDEMERVKDSRA
ncbi:hypothetical protein Tco_0849452 [Tanacetum coccineum]